MGWAVYSRPHQFLSMRLPGWGDSVYMHPPSFSSILYECAELAKIVLLAAYECAPQPGIVHENNSGENHVRERQVEW
eukprot:COSAG01_NODE_3384_length_6158_cov_1.609176_3_plen_77_part_00